MPPHFYGELTKTPEGCQLLQRKGHFAEFAHFIRQHGAESSDSELINKLKSVLWAVGNIGANELGLPFLEAEDVVSQIVEIAETSQVLSVRGTCFFVLGLISSTNSGAEALQDYGWQSVCTPLGAPMGLCIPDDINRLVSLPRWDVNKVPDLSYLELAEPETLVVNKIITSIANLGNSILATNASRSLSKLKAKHKSAFKDMSVLARALELMDHFYFRVSVRRYVWELFDVSLDEDVIQDIQSSRQKLIEAKRLRSAQLGSTSSGGAARYGGRSRGGSLDDSASTTRNGTSRQKDSQQLARRKQQQPGLSALAGDDSASQSDSDGDDANSMPRSSARAHRQSHDDSDEEDEEVGLSSNMSSDDEASDTSLDEPEQALHPEHAGNRAIGGRAATTAATNSTARRTSIRSSTLKGHWNGGGGGGGGGGRHETAVVAEKVAGAPVKKVVGFGIEEL